MTRAPLPVAVIDTSVLVSNANREHLVTGAYEALYRTVWSPGIIAELNQVMTWNWVRNKGLKEREQWSRRYKDMMSLLTGAFSCVDPKLPWQQAWPELTGTDDLPIWSTAKFVSANIGDFPPSRFEFFPAPISAMDEEIAQTAAQDHLAVANAYQAFAGQQQMDVLTEDVHPSPMGQMILAKIGEDVPASENQ